MWKIVICSSGVTAASEFCKPCLTFRLLIKSYSEIPDKAKEGKHSFLPAINGEDSAAKNI